MADIGIGAASWLLGALSKGEDVVVDNSLLEFPTQPNYENKRYFSSQLPPLDPDQYLTSSPALPPAHYVTKSRETTENFFDNFVDEDDVYSVPQEPTISGSSLAYDPATKTLFIDKESAAKLNLADGDTLPVPNEVLAQAIDEGQVALMEDPVGVDDVGYFPVQSTLSYSGNYAPVRNLFQAAKSQHIPTSGQISNLYPSPISYPPRDTQSRNNRVQYQSFQPSFKAEDPQHVDWVPVNKPSKSYV